MGNTESNVTSGVKKQAGASMLAIYKLCDLKGSLKKIIIIAYNFISGGGLLVELMKRAAQNKQYAEIDHAIKSKIEPFLYNKGQGMYIPISQLVLLRNKDRPRHKWLPQLKVMENPEDFEIDDENINVSEEEYQRNPHLYRFVCWRIKERGAVGEALLHLCLLNATSIHADIAKRLLRFYPKLINDIYMSDEYYGENVLHIAIVNEDPSMVRFLLDAGVNIQERCFGNFMCPEDQKSSRSDSLDHEWVNVYPITNYDGYVYWGEYPLSFAACLGQEECYRLMLSRGADPDAQDTNGNTVLHLLVIYQKIEAFDMAYEVGASLDIRNVMSLTPVTLAASLARVDMFFHILNIEREIYWQIGSITCAAYPLSQIDTIDIKTGQISKTSVLNSVVFGDKDEHLELMDGVVIDLLNAKWNTFVKKKFYRQFFTFAFYFIISLICFTLRPGPPINAVLANGTNTTNTTTKGSNITDSLNLTLTFNDTAKNESISSLTTLLLNFTIPTEETMVEEWWYNLTEKCRLMRMNDMQSKIRIAAEVAMFFGAFLYLAAAVREAKFLGMRMFYENLVLNKHTIETFCSLILISAYYIIFLSFDNPLTPEDVDDSATNPMATPMESIMAMFLMSLTNFGDYYSAFSKTKHEYVAKV
ncbi:transient receptor potential ion channel protein [Holotrichia oblita]|uniref:Transient receptor potential ion channel protein n=1 Tax=Holotrichia oblita TaxID=644536 RepID=A0ACB9TGC9_HOLOL|nr:transient receptor potential ion channel protein [Holotrichia oblita]